MVSQVSRGAPTAATNDNLPAGASEDPGGAGHAGGVPPFGFPIEAGQSAVEAYVRAVEFGAGNLTAALHSGVILSRGLRALRQAWTGVASMVMEETATSVRALAASASVPDAIRLSTQLCFLHTGRTVAQTTLVTTMLAQVLEDAAFPVVSRLSARH